ncbi:ABC transporter substrate-binding protein [Enterococcus timonensis]|uniref:ABC transporter substrate-binding protein n=1 Tax=Enterococcus timonensis TaxID=1852364 RepID=UPI0008D9FA48|nr:ABC transporter substrate-binding protein [Enterococcus timonensis]
MKKRNMLIGGLLFATVLMGACSSGSADNKETTKESSGGKEPITLSFFSADLTEDDKFDNPVAKEITKRTGVTLEISHPVGGDEQAVPLMIASGDYPDMLFAKGDLNKLIEAGGALALDDLIEEKGENIKKLYEGNLDRLKNSLEDPQIYHLGTGGVETVYNATSGTFQIQLDVLKQLGYPTIRTLEDFESALKDYIAKNPEIDGQKTVGMSLLGSDWRWLITVGNPSGFAAGYQDDGQWIVDLESGETTYKFQDEKIKDYFKWLNHMYAEGLIDPESFTQKYDTYIAKLSAGNVLAVADQDWDISSAVAALKGDGKNWRTFAPLPVTLSEDILSPSTKDYGFTGTTGISISSTSEHPEEAFEFLDWMASEEAQILVNWGLEGVNYEIKDGKRVATDLDEAQTDPQYKNKTGIGSYIWPFPQWGNGAEDSTGQPIARDSTKELKEATYTAEEKEVLKAYDAQLWVDLFPSAEELGGTKHGRAYEIAIPADSDLTVTQQRADDYTTQAITDIIISSPDDFETKWSAMQDELSKLNIEDADKEMTKLVQDRMELWSE